MNRAAIGDPNDSYRDLPGGSLGPKRYRYPYRYRCRHFQPSVTATVTVRVTIRIRICADLHIKLLPVCCYRGLPVDPLKLLWLSPIRKLEVKGFFLIDGRRPIQVAMGVGFHNKARMFSGEIV